MGNIQWMVNTHSQKTNITDVRIRQSCKPFGVIHKSECLGDWYMQWKKNGRGTNYPSKWLDSQFWCIAAMCQCRVLCQNELNLGVDQWIIRTIMMHGCYW